jgi:hypothetical protein
MKFEWDLTELVEFANNLENVSRFEREMQFAAKELAAALLRQIKNLTPIGDTYQLVNGWNGNDFAVKKVNGGFEVLLVNKDEKALWVNDGHRSFNKFNVGTNDPYVVHTRKKVRSPYKWQQGDGTHWVYGHFFVERGILQLNNAQQVEQIIMRKLQKWWNSV